MVSKLSETITYGTVDEHYAECLASVTPEQDGAVWMVNLMKYREVAVYDDGRESTISGTDADARYAPFANFGEPAPHWCSSPRSRRRSMGTARTGMPLQW